MFRYFGFVLLLTVESLRNMYIYIYNMSIWGRDCIREGCPGLPRRKAKIHPPKRLILHACLASMIRCHWCCLMAEVLKSFEKTHLNQDIWVNGMIFRIWIVKWSEDCSTNSSPFSCDDSPQKNGKGRRNWGIIGWHMTSERSWKSGAVENSTAVVDMSNFHRLIVQQRGKKPELPKKNMWQSIPFSRSKKWPLKKCHISKRKGKC